MTSTLLGRGDQPVAVESVPFGVPVLVGEVRHSADPGGDLAADTCRYLPPTGLTVQGAGDLKVLRFIKRSSGLSVTDFRNRYEAEVAPAIPTDLVMGYRRNYVLHDDEFSFSGGVQDVRAVDPDALAFDMIEEFWLRRDLEFDCMPEAGVLAGLVDEDVSVHCAARECRTPGGVLAAPLSTIAAAQHADRAVSTPRPEFGASKPSAVKPTQRSFFPNLGRARARPSRSAPIVRCAPTA